MENKMGTKKVFPLLMSMAFPPMLSMLIQSLYNIIDSIYVAQYSENAITAVSLAFPIQNFILAVAVGIGVGMNSYISRKLGQKDIKEANSAVAHGILAALVCSLVFAAASFIIVEPFFKLYADSLEIYTMAVTYTRIIMFFSFAQIVHIAIEKVFQASGNMIMPMLFQAIGAIVNIILDPLFIFTFKMGVQGAAVATIIGQLTSLVLSLLVFLKKPQIVKLDFHHFKLDVNCLKQIFSVGFPMIVMNSLGSILVMGLNSLLISFSNLAVSLFGIYYKLQTFVFMPVIGLTQGAMPILGYNYGAKLSNRVHQTLHYSLFVSFVIMLAGTCLFYIWPEFLLNMFNASEDMMSMGVVALKIICLSYIPATFGLILPTLFNAIGKGMYSFVIFMVRQLVVLLPLAYLLSMSFGLNGIWAAFPVSEMIAALLALILYLKTKHHDAILSGK